MKSVKSVLCAVMCALVCLFPVQAIASSSSSVTVRASLDDVSDYDSGTYCGVSEHRHVSGVCYDSDGNLTCTRQVHEHVDACYVGPADIQSPGFSLLMPSVGGSGVVWIYTAGGIVLLIGVIGFIVNHRKNKKEGR